jgi:hypothetical protein
VTSRIALNFDWRLLSKFRDGAFRGESERESGKQETPGCFDLAPVFVAIGKMKVGSDEGRKGKKNPQYGGLCGFLTF